MEAEVARIVAFSALYGKITCKLLSHEDSPVWKVVHRNGDDICVGKKSRERVQLDRRKG
jgi:hypothetical protein